jgi:hypothetical protein
MNMKPKSVVRDCKMNEGEGIVNGMETQTQSHIAGREPNRASTFSAGREDVRRTPENQTPALGGTPEHSGMVRLVMVRVVIYTHTKTVIRHTGIPEKTRYAG